MPTPRRIRNGSGGSGHDAAGNLVGVMDTVMGTWSYSYDPLNRLVTQSASMTLNLQERQERVRGPVDGTARTPSP